MSVQRRSEATGPPYLPPIAFVGGTPTLDTDVPICAFLLLLYAGAAIGHNATFQVNRIQGRKFFPSILLFGFCMARILTCALRIGWATHGTNVSLVIAANVFVPSGIMVVWIINIIFTQRIIRAVRPKIGWHPVASMVPKLLYAMAGLALALVIGFTISSYYRIDASFQTKARDVQRTAITYMLVFTLAPILTLPIAFFKGQDAQDFGTGGMGAKIVIVWVSSLLCLVEQIFRTATTWAPARPANDPAWYDSRAWFYEFGFVIELLVVYWLLLARIDRRFHVPDGSSKRGHYHAPEDAGGWDRDRARLSTFGRKRDSYREIGEEKEERIFRDSKQSKREDLANARWSRTGRWDNRHRMTYPVNALSGDTGWRA